MGKSSPPAPPDPKVTGAAQTATNVNTALANAYLGNVNQVTPYGSLTYKPSGQNFIPDSLGGTWYKSPDGKYTQTAPTAPVTASGKTPVKMANAAGGTISGGSGNNTLYGGGGTDGYGGGYSGGNPQVNGPGSGTGGGTKSTTTGGALPTGWTQVNGYQIPTWTATQTLSPTQQKIFDASQQAQINLANVAQQQSGRLGDLLNRPMDLSKLPAGGNAANLDMPQYQQFSAGNALKTGIADAGNITKSIAGAGNIANTFGDAGNITRTYGTDFSADRQKVEDALFARMNPQLTQDRTALETSLANQGIRVGSDAYRAAMGDFNQQSNDARYGAILNAGQEQSRLVGLENSRAIFQNQAQQQAYDQAMGRGTFANDAQAQRFGQNATSAQFANQAQQQQYGQNASKAAFYNDATQAMNDNKYRATAGNNGLQDQALNASLAKFNAMNQQRNQGLQETFATRNQPLNEITALLNGSQVQAPQWANTNQPTIPTVDYAGLVNENYNQKLGVWQQQQAQSQNLLGGLFGLGSSLIGLSDDDAKKDKSKVMELAPGAHLWTFKYKGEPKDAPKRLGLMASEVENVVPEAVSRRADGLRQVDYGKALTGLFAMGAANA